MKRIVATAVVVVCTLGAAAPASPASPPRQTREQAERNLLHATRLLERWHVGLVATSTHLLKQNTTASCRGVGAGLGDRYTIFRCVLRHASRRVAVRYIALRGNGFEAHRV